MFGLSADVSVGFGYDAGTQGFLASVGTSEGLTGTNLQLGGKDVTARGALPARPVSRPSGSAWSRGRHHLVGLVKSHNQLPDKLPCWF